MTSSIQKGKKEVKKVIDEIYVPNGWRCWKPGNAVKWIKDKRTGRWIPLSQSQDIFECYDFQATKRLKGTILDDGLIYQLHAVQVTSIQVTVKSKSVKGGVTSDVAKRRAKIDELGIEDGNTVSVVFARKPRHQFRVWIKILPRMTNWIEMPLEEFIERYLR